MNLHNILIMPYLTEKSELLRFSVKDGNRYTFKVHPAANKESIRQALHKIYSVKAEKVNIIRVRGKSKRFRTGIFQMSGWKKAVITLAPGQTLELNPGSN